MAPLKSISHIHTLKIKLPTHVQKLTFYVILCTYAGKNMNLKELILEKAKRGYCFFTTSEANETLGGSRDAVERAIGRAHKQGELASPVRGVHLIVPPEYRDLGCLPAEQFIPELMEFLAIPYYVCLLSAAQYHGAAHQRPQVFQVMVERRRRPIMCGKVRVEFITNKNIVKSPTQQFNTRQGILKVSTPELTALDLVSYPGKAAGLDNVFNVLIELAETIDPQKLKGLLEQKQEATWLQRLGYLFELMGEKNLVSEIETLMVGKRVRARLLSSSDKMNKRLYFNKKWKLWINEEIEVDV